jgi:chorismate-pyruvate lyase
LVRAVELGVEGEEMISSNHRERQFTQPLRGTGWVRAIALPDSPKPIVAHLFVVPVTSLSGEHEATTTAGAIRPIERSMLTSQASIADLAD